MGKDDPTTILIVEDDPKLAKSVKDYLESNHYRVLLEERGDSAPVRILSEKPDLVLLDIMLPGKDGLTICREVRPEYSGPIIMLTALDEETDEVVGLEIGADDYLTKPVSPRLLLTRIHAQLRRTERESDKEKHHEGQLAKPSKKIVIGTLTIDSANRLVWLDDNPIDLTTAEFDLLYYLAQHPGEVLTREQIYPAVRGFEYDGIDRSIDLRIARLRKKLGDDTKQSRRIKAVRGTGYLFAEDQ